MSWSELCVQDRRRRTDCAIHRACAQLASDPTTLKKFQEILICARRRAPRLFEARVSDGFHPGVEALVNLSRFRAAHVRPVIQWVGTSSSWRPAVASLAHHLVCDYRVPMFLASSWYAVDSIADEKRGWYIAHSRGASFRSLKLPIAMTRRMEHIFLASHDHLPIEEALREAELLALGAPNEIVRAVMSTRLATDLSHGEFWRTVWLFLIANADNLDPAQIGPMIDYIQAVRHERRRIERWDGVTEAGALQPEFSMKGRTVQSMLRLMTDWHRAVGAGVAALSWAGSQIQPLLIEEPGQGDPTKMRRWQMIELTNSVQLRAEGAALRHCVASYASKCVHGSSSIWSLRLWKSERVHSELTVEVDRKRRAVIQARGLANRPASGKPLRLLEVWAARERLEMAI